MTISATDTDIDCSSSGGRRPLAYVHRHLEKDVVPDKLYSRDNIGIPDSLHFPAADPASVGVVVHFSDRHRSGRVGERGSDINVGQRSNRRDSSFSRLLQPSLRGSEERRRVSTGYQFETDQQRIPRASTFQDGRLEGSGHSAETRRLGSVCGSEGCILPYPPEPTLPPLPPVWLEKETVSISSSSIRPLDRPVRLHHGDKADRSLSPLTRNSGSLLSRRYPGHRQDKGRMREKSQGSSRPPSVSRISHQLEEIQSRPKPTVPLPRPPLGLHSGSDLSSAEQTLEPTTSGKVYGEDSPHLPRASGPPRSHDRVHSSRSIDSPLCSPSSTRPSGGLLISPPKQASGEFVTECQGQSQLDSLFGSSPLSSPDVASSGRKLRSGGVDRRLRPGVGDSFRRAASPGSVDCGCPSPYQCEGAYHAPHFPPGLSSFLRPSSRTAMEVGQYDGNFLHKEGRRYGFTSPPSNSNGHSSPCRPDAVANSPRICTDRRESSGGCGIAVPVSSGLAFAPLNIQPHLPTLGNTGNRSVCDRELDAANSFLRLGSSPNSRSVRRPPPALELPDGVCVSSSSSPASRPQQDSGVDGGVHPYHPPLENAEVVSTTPRNGHSGSTPPPASSRLGSGSNNGFSASQARSASSSRLEDFRRLHASSISDESFNLVAGSWRKSSSDRYDAAWRSFKDFLSSRGVSLDQVDLKAISDYLSHLFAKRLAYRTICLHRSVISMTLPHIDGVAIGEHPLICRLIKGIFNKRPPTRRAFDAWDVSKVFKVFSSWPAPLSLKQTQRKAAFLVAMATARRPSELSSLQCSASFMTSTMDELRFIPSCLSKTDRQTHLGPPIVVTRLPDSDSSLCAVKALEDLLRIRSTLQLDHNYVFFQFKPPYEKVSSATFSQRLAWALKSAGISAPPGSTRSVSVSDAFACGVDLESILRAGDWSGARTFYRHYLRPSFASSQ